MSALHDKVTNIAHCVPGPDGSRSHCQTLGMMLWGLGPIEFRVQGLGVQGSEGRGLGYVVAASKRDDISSSNQVFIRARRESR